MELPNLVSIVMASTAGSYLDMNRPVRWPDFWLNLEHCQCRFIGFLSWLGLPGSQTFWWVPFIQNRVARIQYQRESLGVQVAISGMSGVLFLVSALAKKALQISGEAKG